MRPLVGSLEANPPEPQESKHADAGIKETSVLILVDWRKMEHKKENTASLSVSLSSLTYFLVSSLGVREKGVPSFTFSVQMSMFGI